MLQRRTPRGAEVAATVRLTCWQTLSNTLWYGYHGAMSTMNVSLPASLKEYVDEQATSGGYGSSSEYVRELIRRDQERTQLRRLLLDGAESALGRTANAAYFSDLRSLVSAGQPE